METEAKLKQENRKRLKRITENQKQMWKNLTTNMLQMYYASNANRTHYFLQVTVLSWSTHDDI